MSLSQQESWGQVGHSIGLPTAIVHFILQIDVVPTASQQVVTISEMKIINHSLINECKIPYFDTQAVNKVFLPLLSTEHMCKKQK